MKVDQARKLLGKQGDGYSDEQIKTILKQIKGLTDACVDVIDQKIKVEGIGFLDIDSKKQ
ncbi:MAG: hypothetical protein PHO75_02945 [Candidatus Shapirobacteria bacterium]|nr:hypothetical protein [Candidatus Shapirobacteria bacterium]